MKAPAFFHDRGIRRYDDAGRLVKFHSEDSTYDLRWNLTAAGNWRQVKDYMYYTNLDVREHNSQNAISRHQVRVSGSFVDVKPEVNLSADSYDVTVWPIEWAVLHHRWQERPARASKVRDQGAMTPASTMSEPRGP